MLKKELSEKLSEILFTAYFLRLFELGDIEFYAPSQVKELELGYDAQFTGKTGAWEVILQFKQPSLRTDGFTIKVDQRQLRTLHRLRDGHIFYAAPAHRSFAEVAQLQRDVRHPCDFLNTYILLDVHDLPLNTATIRYDRIDYGRFYKPFDARYRLARAGPSESDHHCIKHLHVCGFAEAFREHRVGAEIGFRNEDLPAGYVRRPNNAEWNNREEDLLQRLGTLVSRKEPIIVFRLN